MAAELIQKEENIVYKIKLDVQKWNNALCKKKVHL